MATLSLSWLAVGILWSSSASSSPVIVSPGMNNLGNTCYLNSQLECAFHIPKVRSLIESPPPLKVVPSEDVTKEEEDDDDEFKEEKKEAETTNDEEINLDEPGESSNAPEVEVQVPEESLAVQAMRNVFQDMKASSSPVAPRILCQILGIPVMEQQDSQEFWKLLLPALNLPALTDLYQGSFEDYIKADDGSDRERRREEAFLDLSLDVSKSTVLEGLKDSFGTPELLSVAEGNGWRPEKGADKVDALKGSLLRVQGLPSILQLHLKRFNYDWQTDQMSKINNRCMFPEELDLSTVCAEVQDSEKTTATYALQSILIHCGDYGSGHYYAYVRPDILSDDWYRFNDHVVTKVTLEEVFADGYGGKNPISNGSKKGGGGPLGWIKSIFQPQQNPFGFGGRTSNAYVVQYVRRSDIESLYLLDKETQ